MFSEHYRCRELYRLRAWTRGNMKITPLALLTPLQLVPLPLPLPRLFEKSKRQAFLAFIQIWRLPENPRAFCGVILQASPSRITVHVSMRVPVKSVYFCYGRCFNFGCRSNERVKSSRVEPIRECVCFEKQIPPPLDLTQKNHHINSSSSSLNQHLTLSLLLHILEFIV